MTEQNRITEGNKKCCNISILSHRINMTQKELQEILQIQPGSMSEILSKLEVKELIFRRKSEDDKRKIVLELTDSGKLYANNQAEQNMEKELFSVLDEKEYETLVKLLKKLLDSWN